MKKFIALFAMGMLLAVAGFSQSNVNSLSGRAKAAVHANCQNAQGNLTVGNPMVVSACFAGGFITKVNVYRVPNCPPNQFCIQVIEHVGTVTFGCDNDIINVECGRPSI